MDKKKRVSFVGVARQRTPFLFPLDALKHIYLHKLLIAVVNHSTAEHLVLAAILLSRYTGNLLKGS